MAETFSGKAARSPTRLRGLGYFGAGFATGTFLMSLEFWTSDGYNDFQQTKVEDLTKIM